MASAAKEFGNAALPPRAARVVEIALDRPQKLNAMNPQFWLDIKVSAPTSEARAAARSRDRWRRPSSPRRREAAMGPAHRSRPSLRGHHRRGVPRLQRRPRPDRDIARRWRHDGASDADPSVSADSSDIARASLNNGGHPAQLAFNAIANCRKPTIAAMHTRRGRRGVDPRLVRRTRARARRGRCAPACAAIAARPIATPRLLRVRRACDTALRTHTSSLPRSRWGSRRTLCNATSA